jgi:hypothetical protein
MANFSLPQIHEVSAENEDRKADDEKRKTEVMQ